MGQLYDQRWFAFSFQKMFHDASRLGRFLDYCLKVAGTDWLFSCFVLALILCARLGASSEILL